MKLDEILVKKGDGLINGTLYVCERDFTLQYKTSNKKKRFTLVELATLSSKPLMCYVILKGETIAQR